MAAASGDAGTASILIVMIAHPGPPPRPIPPLLAAVTAVARPVWTVRQTRHARLWQAWVVHLLGLGTVLIAWAVLQAWSGTPYPTTLSAVLSQVMSDAAGWQAVEMRVSMQHYLLGGMYDSMWLVARVAVSGFIACVLIIGATLPLVLLCGLTNWRSDGTSLLTEAMQAACYLGGYLCVWSVVGWIAATVAMVMDRRGTLHLWEGRMGLDMATLPTALFFVLQAGLLVGFVLLLGTISRRLRQSNR